jgi:thioredoxin reductase
VYDTVIVGGGPAGLSAALVLGRCRRRVVVCDTGTPRNEKSRELHGFLTRDGIPPCELLRLGREQLQQYGVELRPIEVSGIRPAGDGFDVELADGATLETQTVLLASGIQDELPRIDGLQDCFGITAHHCPYCDGWEVRDKAVVVIGPGARGAALALALKTWSGRVTLCSNGSARLRGDHRAQLTASGIELHDTRVATVEHSNGFVHHVVFTDGERLPCEAIFIAAPQHQQCELPRQLGCELTRHGLVKTDHLGQTGVPGLYVAGDASRDVQFVVVAAAEGAKAAVAINKALQARAGLAVRT